MRFQKFLLALMITLIAFSVGNAIAAPPITDKQETTVQKNYPEIYPAIDVVYKSQLGVRELTGRNDGLEVEMYLKNVGLTKGYAWCSAFVRWCFDQAGIKTTINAYSPTAHNGKNLVYFNKKLFKEARAGDVFTLFYTSLGRIGHTGFYDHSVNSSIYSTVEGNTNEAGSREGDGVYRKYRSYNATYSITRWV